MLVADQPENLNLCSYNLNDHLNDPEIFQARAYDLIHSRFVGAGIKRGRWSSYIQDMRILLRPGGWIQITEYYLNIQSSNGSLSDDSAIRRWWNTYAGAMESLNSAPRIGQKLQQLLTEARLSDVRVDTVQLPIGGWSPGTPFRISFLELISITWYKRVKVEGQLSYSPVLRSSQDLFKLLSILTTGQEYRILRRISLTNPR